MSAGISQLYNCPKCLVDMSAMERPERCPGCGFVFTPVDTVLAAKFSWEKSPYRQLFELVQQDMDRLKGKQIKDIVKVVPPNIEPDTVPTVEALHGLVSARRKIELQEFFAKTTAKEVEEWFQSVMHLFQVAHYSDSSELPVLCAVWGKKMGEYANTLEYMIKRGTVFYKRPPPEEKK